MDDKKLTPGMKATTNTDSPVGKGADPGGFGPAPTSEAGVAPPVALPVVVTEADARALAEAGGAAVVGEALSEAIERDGLRAVLRRATKRGVA